MRRSLDIPLDLEIGFVSFVRASGRSEAACLREREYASVNGLPIIKFLFGCASSPSLMASCVLPSFFLISYICLLIGAWD